MTIWLRAGATCNIAKSLTGAGRLPNPTAEGLLPVQILRIANDSENDRGRSADRAQPDCRSGIDCVAAVVARMTPKVRFRSYRASCRRCRQLRDTHACAQEELALPLLHQPCADGRRESGSRLHNARAADQIEAKGVEARRGLPNIDLPRGIDRRGTAHDRKSSQNADRTSDVLNSWATTQLYRPRIFPFAEDRGDRGLLRATEA